MKGKYLLNNNTILDISIDESPLSPDEDGDESIFLVFDHRQFDVQRQNFNPNDIFEHLKSREDNDYEYKELYSDYFIFPVSAYIHSGVVLNLGKSTGWDYSCNGFVLVAKEEINDESAAREYAENLIKKWNIYLQGNVYEATLYKQEPYITVYKNNNKPNKQGFELEEINSVHNLYEDDEEEKFLAFALESLGLEDLEIVKKLEDE